MRTQFTIAILVFSPAVVTAADPAPWKLPEAEGKKWVARVEKSVARKEWKVELDGNDIVVRREKPVELSRVSVNAPPGGSKPAPAGERVVKYVLRFAPKMSVDEYERLAAVNAESDKERDRLHQAVGLPHKFDDFVATTPEEKKRVTDFHAAVAKLPRHALPDLYTPDHAISFLESGDGWTYPSDKDVSAECGDVKGTLQRLFGMYNPAVAGRGFGRFGDYLPEPRK